MKRILFILLSIQLLFATSNQILKSGKAIEGTVKHKEKRYYSITVPKNKSLRVNLTELEADVDLYIKKGNEVRVRFNDCYSSSSNRENEECLLTNKSKSSIYTILINGFKASSYNLKATIEEAEKIPTLGAIPIEDTVEKKEGKQYQFSAKKGIPLKVTLFYLTADADLFVRVGRKAGLHSFNCKSIKHDIKTDECVITPKKDATVYVYVYGHEATSYSLKALQETTSSNFCLTKEELMEKIKNDEDVSDANTSCINNMDYLVNPLYTQNKTFNQDISKWDVSHVTSMTGMFAHCEVFNQDISSWDVSNVTNMYEMFEQAKSFNQPIGKWNVSKVTNIRDMFDDATAFNQPIGNWDVSKVKNMERMFWRATAFNQPIGNWDVSKVTNILGMFGYATSFNQPIGDWNTSNITDMQFAFEGAKIFNQPIGNWDTSNVLYIWDLFSYATSFNQPIGNWDVSKIRNMSGMFDHASEFNQNISNWNTSNVFTVENMFRNATKMEDKNKPIFRNLGKW